VSHLDLYRVADLREEDPDLLADYVGSDRIAFVEWPGGAVETLAGLSRLAARVRIEHAGGDRRVVMIEAPVGADRVLATGEHRSNGERLSTGERS